MGLIHTPRTLYSIWNGYYKRQIYLRKIPPQKTTGTTVTTATATKVGGENDITTTMSSNSTNQKSQPSKKLISKSKPIIIPIGFQSNPHIYTARLGLFDVDYLGHMNNASYLTHAELARWELTSYNGMLSTMLQQNVHFLVVGTTIRYRKEIRPLFGTFTIDTYMCGLDDRNLFMIHQFRTKNKNAKTNNTTSINDTSSSSSSSSSSPSRIMAQMIVQGVAVQNGRTVINPAIFLKDNIGFDPIYIDPIMLTGSNTHTNNNNNGNKEDVVLDDDDDNKIIVDVLDRYTSLEDAMKQAAAQDDKKHSSTV